VKRSVVVALSTAVAVGLALLPEPAHADRFHGRGGRVIVSGHHGHKPFAHSHHHHAGRFAHHRPFAHHGPFVHHRPFVFHRFHRPFVPFVVAASPSIVYAETPVYYPPVAYAPPPAYAPAGAIGPAPMPTVVQHPHGRYELRGDGVSVPYRWVWIPNPPSPPPAQVDPPAAPSGAAPSDPPRVRRPAELYRWTDEQGVVHWTDRRDAVPEQYRKRAMPTPPS
jgi:Domain of unknown function (DUF4124)